MMHRYLLPDFVWVSTQFYVRARSFPEPEVMHEP